MMTLATVAIIAICAGLVLYVLYSVIWRAVRRGMSEYNLSQRVQPAPPAMSRPQSRLTRSQLDALPAPVFLSAPVRSMRLHLPHRPAAKVPDYLPSDWV